MANKNKNYYNAPISDETVNLLINFCRRMALEHGDKEDNFSLGMASGMEKVADSIQESWQIGKHLYKDKLSYQKLGRIMGIIV